MGGGRGRVNSGETWKHVNEMLGESKTISRASVIFHLNRIVDQSVLGYRDATGKGVHHRIYVTKMDENGYRKYLLKTVIESMKKDFPEETGGSQKFLSASG